MKKPDFTKYLQNPILFPEEFKEWIVDFYATNIPKIPVSQILGFQLYALKHVDTIGSEVTNSASYATDCQGITSTTAGWIDLATPGPSIEGMANGIYLVIYGAFQYGNSDAVWSGVSVDGAAVDEDEAIQASLGHNARMFIADLALGNHDHTLAMKYKNTGAFGGWFSSRWLHAIRVTEPLP
jgi:hypothetical protein